MLLRARNERFLPKITRKLELYRITCTSIKNLNMISFDICAVVFRQITRSLIREASAWRKKIEKNTLCAAAVEGSGEGGEAARATSCAAAVEGVARAAKPGTHVGRVVAVRFAGHIQSFALSSGRFLHQIFIFA